MRSIDDDWIDCQYNNYLSDKEFKEAEIRRNLEKYHTFRAAPTKTEPKNEDSTVPPL